MAARNGGMSLRQIAKVLGVSHTLLVLWRQGKRNLAPELEAGYHAIVTGNGYKSGYKDAVRDGSHDAEAGQFVAGKPGAGDGIRTHDILLGKQTLYP